MERATARQVKCSSTLRQIGQANQIYANDFEGMYVPQAQTGDVNGWPHNWYSWIWHPHFERSMSLHRSGANAYNAPPGLICPDATAALEDTSRGDNRRRLGWSYGMNRVELRDPVPWWDIARGDYHGAVAYSQVDVIAPARKMFYADALDRVIHPSRFWKYPQMGEAPSGSMAAPRHFFRMGTGGQSGPAAPGGERGQMNALYFDGHADAVDMFDSIRDDQGDLEYASLWFPHSD